MIEEKERPLLPVSLQCSEKVPPAGRRFKESTGDGFLIKDILEKPGSFHFVPGWIGGIDSEILLEVAGRFV